MYILDLGPDPIRFQLDSGIRVSIGSVWCPRVPVEQLAHQELTRVHSAYL